MLAGSQTWFLYPLLHGNPCNLAANLAFYINLSTHNAKMCWCAEGSGVALAPVCPAPVAASSALPPRAPPGRGGNLRSSNVPQAVVSVADRFKSKAQDGVQAKSSPFKGVSWHKHSQKWYAYIQVNGKMRGIGYFESQEEAARRYDAEARRVRFCWSWLQMPENLATFLGAWNGFFMFRVRAAELGSFLSDSELSKFQSTKTLGHSLDILDSAFSSHQSISPKIVSTSLCKFASLSYAGVGEECSDQLCCPPEGAVGSCNFGETRAREF